MNDCLEKQLVMTLDYGINVRLPQIIEDVMNEKCGTGHESPLVTRCWSLKPEDLTS